MSLLKRNTVKLALLIAFHFLPAAAYPLHAQSNTGKGFIIKGHITGIADGTPVYLFNIDEQANIDTAYARNGNFLFEGYVQEPTICWINCRDQYAIINVENVEMTVESPLQYMRIYAKITGGREQQHWNEMASQQYLTDKIFFTTYDTLMKKMYVDETHKSRLLKEFNEAQAVSQMIYVNYGKTHPDSYLGVDIIYRNREKIGKDSALLLFSQMTEALQMSNKARGLREFLFGRLVRTGGPFMDFTARTLDGKEFSLSSLKGSNILLTFWDAACVPCRRENKLISQRYKMLEDQVKIVSFSIDKNLQNWQKASKEDDIQWTNVSDLEGSKGRIKTQYEVQAIPTAYLINKEGIVVQKIVGIDNSFLELLEKMLR